MNHAQALLLAAVGLTLVVVGSVWLFGPWALVGSGLCLFALALFVPWKERRGEPVPESDLPPPD